MVDISSLKEQVRLMTDESGKPVVQIPLETWDNLLAEITGVETLSHQEKVRRALKYLDENPGDETDEWWDEFQQSLKENRLTFPERDLGLSNE